MTNRAPSNKEFHFGPMMKILNQHGTYVLQYEVQPALPGQSPLTATIKVAVAAGQPVSLEVQV